MIASLRTSTVAASAAGCIALAAAPPSYAQQAAGAGGGAAVRAFTNARVIDGTGRAAIPDGVVVARGGAIVSVGSRQEVQIPVDAEVIDLGGRWLVPGLINAHGHVPGDGERARDQLELYAHYGVTTVVSLGDQGADFRESRESPALRHARLYVAGPVVTPGSPEEARAAAARAAEMNVDWVKTRLSGGARGNSETFRSLVRAAGERGMPVAVHIEELEAAKAAVEGGAVLVAHSVRDLPVDAELIQLMRAGNACLVPTFTRELSTFVYAQRPGFFDDPFFLERAAPPDLEAFLTPQLQEQARGAGAERWRAALPLAMENTRRLHEAGIRIAMGTDTGAPTGRFQGYFEHLELEMMAEAGLTPEAVLHAATRDAAACVGLEGVVGTIVPGAWADFLVVDADPLENVLNLRRIHSVWVAGNPVRDR
jgi:imidazolonepropionase-like amidohydrolase